MKIISRLTLWHWIIITVIFIWIASRVRRGYIISENKDSLMNSNVKAFLKMLRYAEGTSGVNGYRTVYGYEKVLTNLSDHPVATGEWKGKTLTNAQCAGAGLGAGCKSTAAGAYQFIYPTWKDLKSKLGLKDFSPWSQDLAATELLRKNGALALIEAGKLSEAIPKVRKIWASLPNSGYGQPTKNYLTLENIYKQAGGNLA